jgi:transcriptional regulator with XRE-family HTH domain
MTGEQLRIIREDLDLTQEQLADMLDINRRTISRWEQGQIPIPKAIDLAMEALLRRKYTPEH